MRIDIGKDVIASDGEKIGSVDRLVLDSETKDLNKFIVHKGMFWSEDRIVDIDLVSNVDADGNIHLRVPSDDEDTLPAFVEDTHYAPSDDEVRAMGYEAFVGTAPYSPILFASDNPGGSYRPGSGPFFDVADTGPTNLETRTNLPEDSMTIDQGTDVVGRDGDKVGEVDQILVDERGNTTGFVVKSGFLFTHDVQIPIDLVDHMSGERITLKVTGDEAESGYQV